MDNNKTVYVVGRYASYERMYEEHGGYLVVDNIEDADLVQFCGGEDVNPRLYDEVEHKQTFYDDDRDAYEVKMWNLARANECAIVGICRGAQFVHVMNGGKLYQHVTNHGVSGTHIAWLVPGSPFKELAPIGFQVSSTHHQMMREGQEGGELVAFARNSGSKETGAGEFAPGGERDVEAVYHKKTNSFCYQPHPEYFGGTHLCNKMFFSMMEGLVF